MKWVLIITAVVGGHPIHTDPMPFATKEQCLAVLQQAKQHPMYKQYNAKGDCERVGE